MVEINEVFIQELKVTLAEYEILLIEARSSMRNALEYSKSKQKIRAEPWQGNIIQSLEPMVRKLDKAL